MSENEEGPSTLGKRSREEEAENGVTDIPEMPSADMDDSSDEEIGPMPVPESEAIASASNGRKKKKRAGEWVLSPILCLIARVPRDGCLAAIERFEPFIVCRC